LRTGYYPDNARLCPASLASLRKIADFSVRYGNVLYDSELADVSLSHLSGPNAEVVFSDPKVSPKAVPGGILSIARDKDGLRILNFINLSQQTDVRWNAPKSACALSEVGMVSFRRRYPDERFFWADVDFPRLQMVPFEEKEGRITVSLPTFRLWGMLVAKRGGCQ